MLEEKNSRGLIEIAKALGQIEVVPGLKLFTREYFKKGRIIYLDDNHPAEVMKDNASPAPFIFILSSDVTGGEPGIYECDREEGAIYIIDTAFAEFKKAMEKENITGGK
jgi:hypothetical protein